MAQQLLEYRVLRRLVPVVSGFRGEIDLAQVPLRQTWRVDQLTVALFGTTAAVGIFAGQPVLIYDQPQGVTSTNLTDRTVPTIPVDATTLLPVNGAGPTLAADFNDRGSPITIVGGDALCIVFPGSLSVGWTIGLRVQYGVYQGSPGVPTPVAA